METRTSQKSNDLYDITDNLQELFSGFYFEQSFENSEEMIRYIEIFGVVELFVLGWFRLHHDLNHNFQSCA